MAGKARDIMTPDCTCIGENETITTAAKRLEEEGVGAMPVCGEDDRLKGVLTDRDIAIDVVAHGRDPEACTAGEIAGGVEVVTIGADDDLDEAVRTMVDHGVRRLPVIDGHRLVGIVAQADLARSLPPERVGELVGAVSSPQAPNSA